MYEVLLHINIWEDYQMYAGRNGLYGENVKIIIISVIYKVSVNVHFASEGQITQPPPVIVGQVLKEIHFCCLLVY
jgi:hypothetical protein